LIAPVIPIRRIAISEKTYAVSIINGVDTVQLDPLEPRPLDADRVKQNIAGYLDATNGPIGLVIDTFI
jgi:hypothetical protein